MLSSLFVTLNGACFHIEGFPTWDSVFTASELTDANNATGDVSVHFIDVGQGDCELIITPDKTVLIDGGEAEYAQTVISYLKAQNVEKIDYCIVTHPHSDHAGATAAIISKVETENIIMPKLTDDMVPTTSTYTKMIAAVLQEDINAIYAKPDDVIDLGSGCKLEFFSPVKDYDDLNNYSVTCRFTHGENSFFFSGDIESEAESDILDSGADIASDVLKVAHHGSSTSSKKKFLKAVNATYAVIEVGAPNTYNHPHAETVEKLEELNMTIYRTDNDGTIVFSSDGKELKITTEKQ